MKARLPLSLLLLGMALRIAATFPIHAYPADADCVLAGLRAFPILAGHFPVFFVTVRIGAFEIYMHALAFLAFGVSRVSLALAPLLSGCALLLVFHLFSRLLFDRPTANLALLFMALPAPAVLFWTYMPNSYVETMLFCAATLWLAERLRQHPEERLSWLGFGLAAGLGWWNSLLTLSCLLPAVAWLVWGRAFRRPRVAVLAAAGFLIGASPWIAYNIRHPLATFRNNFGSKPATSPAQIGSNATYVLTYSLPELVASVDPENGVNPPTWLQRALRVPVLAVHVSALLFPLVLLTTAARHVAGEASRRPPPAWVLLLLVTVAALSLVIFSEAGRTRGLTVRYVLPFYLTVPGLLALFLTALARKTRSGAVVLSLVVLVFNVSGYFLPGGPTRRLWEQRMRLDDQLVEVLRAHRIDAVCGSYWVTYPVNFLSREAILAIPYEQPPGYDPIRYADRLPAAPLQWALYSRTPGKVEAWASNAGLTGSVTALASDAFVFLPAVNPPPGLTAPELLVRLRGSVPSLLPP